MNLQLHKIMLLQIAIPYFISAMHWWKTVLDRMGCRIRTPHLVIIASTMESLAEISHPGCGGA